MRANNDHVRDLMNYEWEMITGEPMSNRSMTRHTLGEAPRHRLWQAHRGNDRHTNLNVGARRAVTWEFRLWNSTRAAWRMEMYCEMSKAFMDPDFIAVLATLDPPQRFRRVSAGLNLLAEAADRSGYATLPEHILRQAYYLEEKAEHAPQQLTIG